MAEGSGKAREISLLPIDNTMLNGMMYAGISPDTCQAMYTTPADAPVTYSFHQAERYAATLDAHGHHDWRVPTENELNLLFQNRHAIGGFNTSGSAPAGWYWSSSQGDGDAWVQRFSDGRQNVNPQSIVASLRCVR
jgi:hypothetical protein